MTFDNTPRTAHDEDRLRRRLDEEDERRNSHVADRDDWARFTPAAERWTDSPEFNHRERMASDRDYADEVGYRRDGGTDPQGPL